MTHDIFASLIIILRVHKIGRQDKADNPASAQKLRGFDNKQDEYIRASVKEWIIFSVDVFFLHHEIGRVANDDVGGRGAGRWTVFQEIAVLDFDLASATAHREMLRNLLVNNRMKLYTGNIRARILAH